MNEIQKIKPAQEYHTWLMNLKSEIGEKFLLLGKLCKDIRDGNLYKEHDCENFAEYLGMVGLDKSTVYRCIDIYASFVEKWKLDVKRLAPIGYSKLADIIPHASDENFEELIVKAETLSRSDLIEELRGTVAPSPNEDLVNIVITEVESTAEYGMYIPRRVLERLRKQYS